MTPAAATSTPPTSRASMRIRLTLAAPDDHVVLPEIISKEPLGPAVRQGDDQWFDIVKWTLLRAARRRRTRHHPGQCRRDEELGQSGDQAPARRQEADTKIGTDLGLTNDWVVNIIKAVGNYGEIFERNVGAGSPLKIARGLNALWTKGGLQYAPPIR